MKCPTCVQTGLKSSVQEEDSGVMTAMYCPSFFDEDGEEHWHNSNTMTMTYRCTQGHTFNETLSYRCWCGWPEKKAAK